MSKHVVAPAAEIPPGARKVVEAAGKRIVVFNLDGDFFALLDRCPHQGGALSGGIQCGLTLSDEPGRYHFSRSGEFIRCPWHQWEFDIRTGKSWFMGSADRRLPPRDWLPPLASFIAMLALRFTSRPAAGDRA